jgi:hypothetical protein
MENAFRPSHADFTHEAKYIIRNWQGGGRSSDQKRYFLLVDSLAARFEQLPKRFFMENSRKYISASFQARSAMVACGLPGIRGHGDVAFSFLICSFSQS